MNPIYFGSDHHHFREECRHGRVVSQCRCAAEKTVRRVPCPQECDQTDNSSLDRAIFDKFMHQPDTRSKELM